MMTDENATLQIQQELLDLLDKQYLEIRYNKISTLFPDTGDYRRELYPKHVEFMNAGASFYERAFIAANRTGKTLTGGCEMTYHLTGLYPKWWKGRKFKNAIEAWTAGISNQSTKEVQQKELLGDINDIGSGLIPKELIATKPDGSFMITKKPGVADSIETVYVKHISGQLSCLTFKSYEQGRESFQGTKKQVIWLDEEPKDQGIYTECLTRLMDKVNPGVIYCTFTPLFGMSDVVNSFLTDGLFPDKGVSSVNPYKFVANVSWEDVPHLDDGQKASILASYSAHERDARTKGIPSLGAGAIYPYLEDDIVVKPFPIPDWWPRGYGLDTGWQRTAAIWGAKDPDTGIIYLYSEYYKGEEVIPIHASAIKARGAWMVGAADPAGANISDGTKIFELYEAEGLQLIKADKRDVEAGILKVSQLIEAGLLKVFDTLGNWIKEKRAYRRDEKGKVVKKNDHIMDATRYFITNGLDVIDVPPDPYTIGNTKTIAQQRDDITGY